MVEEDGRLVVRLEGGPGAARDARRRLEAMRENLEPELLQDMQLLVTELVTNGVRHGRPEPEGVQVVVEASETRLRGEVADGGTGFSPPSQQRRADPASGWGLYLVDRLAADWGVEDSGGETRVWFELSRAAA